jgi:iron complex transport system permease protein
MALKKSNSLLFFLSLGVLLVLFLLNLAVGSSPIGVRESLAALVQPSREPAASIIWLLRLPKATTCALVGAGLAICGLMMQTIFRNPLAGPDVLGLSSGASLAVAAVLLAEECFLCPWLHPGSLLRPPPPDAR